MDPDIVDHPDYTDEFEAAFAALPTLSLVFDPDALFDPTTGIYQNPTRDEPEWERPLSAEFFVPDGSEPGFQINAGIRIQGGSSRNADTPKHSLSLRFRAEYGDEKLRYPLYRDSPGVGFCGRPLRPAATAPRIQFRLDAPPLVPGTVCALRPRPVG